MKDNQEEQSQIRVNNSSLVANKDHFQEFYPSPFLNANAEQELNIKRLYPFVDESNNPLPRCWNSKDKYQLLSLTHDDLRVHYKGLGKTHKDAAAVRADHPIPAACGLFYFEVRIISKGRDGLFGIGLSQAGVSLNRLPGWDKFSYGYHGDDGHSFSFSGSGVSYGPTFSAGDVIGCGLNLVDNYCFYTKNGYNIGVAFTDLPPDLYPTVGLQTPGEVVEANFGQYSFVFDIYDEIKLVQLRIRAAIQAFDVPMNKTDSFNRLISSYLVHHGYSATAESFNKMTNQTAQEDIESIKRRERISRLILTGRISDAIRLVQQTYPGLLDKNKNLFFMLKCRQFVEMVAGNDDVRHTTSTGFCPSAKKAGVSFGYGCGSSAKSDFQSISSTGPIHQHRHHHHHSHANSSNGDCSNGNKATPPTKKHTAAPPHSTPSPKESPRNSPRASGFGVAGSASPARSIGVSNGAEANAAAAPPSSSSSHSGNINNINKSSSLPPTISGGGVAAVVHRKSSADVRSGDNGDVAAAAATLIDELIGVAPASSYSNGCDKNALDDDKKDDRAADDCQRFDNGFVAEHADGDKRPSSDDAMRRQPVAGAVLPPPSPLVDGSNGFCCVANHDAQFYASAANGTVAAADDCTVANRGQDGAVFDVVDPAAAPPDGAAVSATRRRTSKNASRLDDGDDAVMTDDDAASSADVAIGDSSASTGPADDAAMDTSDCDGDDARASSSQAVLATDANVALVHFGRELHQLSVQIFASSKATASRDDDDVDCGDETRTNDVSNGFCSDVTAAASENRCGDVGDGAKELKMMHDAFSLMAYSDPWTSPVSNQMKPEQREPVAAALNSLILETHGYPSKPPLEIIIAHAQRLRAEMAKVGLGAAAFADPLFYMLP